VGFGVGFGVGLGVGLGVAVGAGFGVGFAVGAGVALGLAVGAAVEFTCGVAIGPPAAAGAGVTLEPADEVGVAFGGATVSPAVLRGGKTSPSAGSRRSRVCAAPCFALCAISMGIAGSSATSRNAFSQVTHVRCDEDDVLCGLGGRGSGERNGGDRGW
jgi:hypothetical protein